MARSDVFSGKVDGVAGIYQRKGNKVTLLIGYAEQVRYKRRFPFEQIGRRAVRNGFNKNFAAAVEAAMATAK
jgi:4-hydroxyphenylpyruvate dioxygenase-like putative hemolysin